VVAAGFVQIPFSRSNWSQRGDGRVLELPGSRAFVYAGLKGVFEPFHA
jgi:hypothetical protein